jgi:hypothetical protein
MKNLRNNPVLIAGAFFALPGIAAAQEITVTVNGAPVPFSGQSPVQRDGAVLVPLRGVFEKLGAVVTYQSSNKSIVAVKGQTTISLRLGESSAVIDGQARALSTPATAQGGTTLVPLRFVSEALGAQVDWNGATRTVAIVTGAPTAQSLPTPPGSGVVIGTITGVFPEARLISVRVGGGVNTRIVLTDDAVVQARSGNATASDAALNALRIGDQVTVQRDGSGAARRVEVVYNERRGEVKSIQRVPSTGNVLVTLTDGAVVEVSGTAPYDREGGITTLRDLRPGETVVIRLNPQTGIGIGVALVTYGTPDPAPPGDLSVSSLTIMGADRPLRAGEKLNVTLRGTAGATGAFTVPGLAGGAPQSLTESSPGVYTGTLAIPAGANLKGATVLASLKRGAATSPAIQSRETVTIDAVGPIPAGLSPAQGAESADPRPLIYGTWSDGGGTGVDPKASKLLVNGREVTAAATLTDAFFSYRPTADLPKGKIDLLLVARDVAGNETRRYWSFMVSPAQNPITGLQVTPATGTLEPGDVVTVRMAATPGGTGHFSIGSAASALPLREESAGVYTGTYTVRKGDALTKAPVTVALTVGGRTVTQTAETAATMAAGTPDAPTILQPRAAAAVGRTVVVAGKAAPGAVVRVQLTYQGKLLIVGAKGTLGSVEVKADAQGSWKTEPLTLERPFGVSDITYTVEAVTVGATGDLSEPATVTFKS